MEDTDISPHFEPLISLLEKVVAQRDYENPDILDAVTRGAETARDARVPPERVLAYLRARLHQAPLAAVGDWYRGVLVDRLVARAITAWYPATPTNDEQSTATGGSVA